MSSSLRLSVPDLGDPQQAASFFQVADAARDRDGYDPFNEQTRIDLAAGHRRPLLAHADGAASGTGPALAAAVVGAGQLDLVVHPDHRGAGVGAAMLNAILTGGCGAGELLAWSHGDHPAARALAAAHRFEPVRTLLQLRLAPLPGAESAPAGAPGIAIGPFRPGRDEAEWVALNARIFAGHPEQGQLTVEDLHRREAEPWFDAGDFLVARDDTGAMVGYNWLKIDEQTLGQTPGQTRTGEIYVIGVDAASAGHGLGRALMRAGLDRMRHREVTAATLYVESDNTPAVTLYRSLGFLDHTVDVQYRRLPG